MTLPNHLFVSDTDGALYDTRVDGWHKLPPLRAGYRGGNRDIDSAHGLKAALRAGPYAWPGGYPMYFVTNGGCALSFESVLSRLCLELASVAEGDPDRIVAVDVNWEDSYLYCDHSGERIKSAYAEPSTDCCDA